MNTIVEHTHVQVWTGNRVKSVCNSVTSDGSSQHWYFAIASKECNTPKLQIMVTCVDGRALLFSWNGLMFQTDVTRYSYVTQ